MNPRIRTGHGATIAALLVIFVPGAITAIVAADVSGGAPIVTLPVNDTLFSYAGAPGRAPALHHESEPPITLLHLEWNKTEFPGPRSMAFGPRYIEFSANPRTLPALVAGAGIAVMAFVIRRKRKAGAGEGESGKEKLENGGEKQV